jgi:uncharacterized phiE125 gp8 family phage protein
MHCLPPELVTPPDGLPVSLEEARAHLREDDEAQDELIRSHIATAVEYLDGYSGILGRALMPQSWRQYFSFWPASRSLELTLAPVASITEIRVRLASGGDQVIDPSGYRLVGGQSRPLALFPANASLPALACEPDAIAVTYAAGYADAASVPARARSAILLMVGDLYRFRGTATVGQTSSIPMSTTVDSLLAPLRRKLI